MTSCWTLTEHGLRGTENQCVALARAVGLTPEIKRLGLRQPWKTLTPWLRHFSPRALTPDSSPLTAPWPDLLIASGRKAIAAALWIKRQSGGRTKLVIVQSPVLKSREFDLVIVPRHDLYDGAHVLHITGALSFDAAAQQAAEFEKWRAVLAPLPAPRVAVLIGGNSRAHQIDAAVATRLIEQLRAVKTQGAGLMITVSRRTPAAVADTLRAALAGDGVHFWDGNGGNPYHAYLAWADAILVTEDSVSMASEAIATGKPVYLLKLAGGSRRFARFHAMLVSNGHARWFEGDLSPWQPRPVDDMAQAVARLRLLGF